MGKPKKAEKKPEAKPEPEKPQRNPLVDKRLKMILARHRRLPEDLVGRMRKCESAGQVKRLLRDHLRQVMPA